MDPNCFEMRKTNTKPPKSCAQVNRLKLVESPVSGWNERNNFVFPVSGFPSSALPGHCDFEAGLCGYTQDKHGDSADWQHRRGATPTSYTGPKGDHTTGLGEDTLTPI